MTLAQIKIFRKSSTKWAFNANGKRTVDRTAKPYTSNKETGRRTWIFLVLRRKEDVLFLTKEGKEFLPYAITVVESLHKAEQMQDLIYKRYTGNIRFAYTRPMSPNYIPNLIRGFFLKNENKKINIESYSAATAVIINDLKNDKIDFGFCSDSEVQDDEIKLIRLIEYPIKLVVNEKDPLCKIQQLHVKDLMTAPGISYTEGSSMDQEIQKFFQRTRNNARYSLQDLIGGNSKFCFLWIRMGIDRTEWSTDDGGVKNP